ncbi:MAG: hypothetical protein AAF433_21050 [Bacteroidota bacterium]
MRYVWGTILLILGIARIAMGRVFQGGLSITLGLIVMLAPENDKQVNNKQNRARQLEGIWQELIPGIEVGSSMLAKVKGWATYSGIAAVFGMKQMANKLLATLAPKLRNPAAQSPQLAMQQLRAVTAGMEAERPTNPRAAVASFQPKDDLLFSIFPFSCRAGQEAPLNGLLLITTSHLVFIDLPETPQNAPLITQLRRVELNLGAREGDLYQVGLFKSQLTSGRDLSQLFLPEVVREAMLTAFDNNKTYSLDLRKVQSVNWSPPDKQAGHLAAMLLQAPTQYIQFWQPSGGSVVGIRAAATAVMEGCWLSTNPLLPAQLDNGARGWKRVVIEVPAAR